ncbi:ArsR/SmtB family transcription factor [Blastococcus sp. SYSU D00813]
MLDERGGPVPVFRALADPLRRQLVGHLCRCGQTSRRELQLVLGVTKTMLTYHVRTLAQAGLIDVHGSARSLSYTVRRATLADLDRWLTDPRSARPARAEEPVCGRR